MSSDYLAEVRHCWMRVSPAFTCYIWHIPATSLTLALSSNLMLSEPGNIDLEQPIFVMIQFVKLSSSGFKRQQEKHKRSHLGGNREKRRKRVTLPFLQLEILLAILKRYVNFKFVNYLKSSQKCYRCFLSVFFHKAFDMVPHNIIFSKLQRQRFDR